MGCGASTDEQSDAKSDGSNDTKYVPATNSQSTEPSAEDESNGDRTPLAGTPQEKAQIEAIKARRRSLKRPCSLAADDTMKHYRVVTGNLRDDDEYFDGTRIKVVASFPRQSVSSSADGMDDESEESLTSPTLGRKSSMRRNSAGMGGRANSGGLKKAVSFHGNGSNSKWKPCVK